MPEMTTHERMSLVYGHREPDRVPITDSPWESTILRWHNEGLPLDVDWQDFFGLDRIVELVEETQVVDTSPRFEPHIIEETDSYKVEQDEWGQTKMNFKPVTSSYRHISSIVHDRPTWETAKRRMIPSPDRIDWIRLAAHWDRWRADGSWIVVAPWYGYDVTSTRLIDSETVLYALADDPAWVRDMCDTGCDLTLSLLEMVWEAGYHFDEIRWFDDMSYKNGPFFSKATWREVVRPYQKRTIEWAHRHGIRAHLHSDGQMTTFVPDLIELGLDMLDPMETRAGVDPLALKREFGAHLALRGGIPLQHWSDPLKAEADVRRMLPELMQGGGYLFSSDHSIPHDVSLSSYEHILATAREVGIYR